ncbi:MAG: hypothetical protein KKB30_03525 [Proteobacteria bacterium]|nr:hypothetical protein [Pseudomonadota bacterium]MBU1715063.1 hypothetical protein [Pseudomonadota bacterium]
MVKQKVVVFSSYPFEPGQKINIADGPRRGDWEIVKVEERKVTLRCPVSGRQFTWDRFCYFMEEREDMVWPG